MSAVTRDTWFQLRALTSARIALGRSGGSLRTETLLELRLAHARAKDALRRPFDVQHLSSSLASNGIECISMESRATTRDEFLRDPELGRGLSDDSLDLLDQAKERWGNRDVVIIVSDGLSALAAEKHTPETILALLPRLTAAGFSHYPICVVPFARVKLSDQIGERIGARLALVLLGERPGLSSPDSLGAYVTYGPGSNRTDADRNCVSNIRSQGLPPAEAAIQLVALMAAARERKLTGVELKVDGIASYVPAIETLVARF